MAERSELDQRFSRRSVMLGAGAGVVFAGLAARLYHLQVVKAEDYRTLSDNNRFNFRTIVPSRGRILDRNGEALANNRQDFRVVLIPERADNIDETLVRMSRYVDLSDHTLNRIKSDISQKRAFSNILIDEHLEWETFAQLNLNVPDLPGVLPLSGETRRYPETGVFSHIIGFVGTPDPNDIEEDDDILLRQPSFQIGKTGVEEAVDKRLRGRAGRLKIEVNAIGRVVREWPEEDNEAVSGEDVYLTLDAKLQEFTAEQFGEDSGGAALIDIETGELRALLSMPTFDANLFVSGLTRADMEQLNSDPRRPQFNKVLGGTYPPASTFKMIVAMAALEAGVMSPEETIHCSGRVSIGDRDFHCWRRNGHGAVNLHSSLTQSCDSYYYEMAQRVGVDAIKNMGQRLGLGQVYELGITGQQSGVLPDDNWKRARVNDGWRTGDTLNVSIGQGYVLATPLQLAVMTARLANGQRAVSPFLIIDPDAPKFETLNVNPVHLELIRNAMFAICEVPGGTAYRPNGLGIKGLHMAGKTGTGQVRGISAAERASGVLRNNELPWEYRDHSLFVGYAPFNNPRFACGVVVEHGGGGSGRAATISRAILGKALERDGLTEASLANELPPDSSPSGTPL